MTDHYDEDDLCNIKGDWVRSWVVEMMKQGKAPRTIHRKVSAYRTFSKYARRKGIMDSNPVESVILPKLQTRLPEVVPEYAMRDLFSEDLFPNDWKGRRDRSMMALLMKQV